MGRTGSWVIAAVIAAAIAFALWSGQSIPDPIGRGSRAPAFTLPRRPGPGEIALEALRGKVVLVNFWATWCKPCEQEMPSMQRLYDAVGPDGFELLAVSVDDESDLVDRFRERLGLRFPILWDRDRRVANEYQAYRFPESYLVDRQGVVVERYIGPREWDSEAYEARIRRLLAGEEE